MDTPCVNMVASETGTHDVTNNDNESTVSDTAVQNTAHTTGVEPTVVDSITTSTVDDESVGVTDSVVHSTVNSGNPSAAVDTANAIEIHTHVELASSSTNDTGNSSSDGGDESDVDNSTKYAKKDVCNTVPASDKDGKTQ
uniref:Uncharacterized protein n=1 Tax=Lygus hesperus TaxID=30085 RepID=A0A0A9X0T2_LYGHE